MKAECIQCDGFGKLFNRDNSCFDCDMCEGSGKMDINHVILKLQGEIIQDWRKSQGLTLRKAAEKYGIDPSNLSKMERGIIKPKKYYNN